MNWSSSFTVVKTLWIVMMLMVLFVLDYRFRLNDSQTKLLLRSNPVSGLTLPIHLKDLSLNLKSYITSKTHTKRNYKTKMSFSLMRKKASDFRSVHISNQSEHSFPLETLPPYVALESYFGSTFLTSIPLPSTRFFFYIFILLWPSGDLGSLLLQSFLFWKWYQQLRGCLPS